MENTLFTAIQNVQCQNITYHHQEGLMSNIRAGVCNCGPEFHLIGHTYRSILANLSWNSRTISRLYVQYDSLIFCYVKNLW